MKRPIINEKALPWLALQLVACVSNRLLVVKCIILLSSLGELNSRFSDSLFQFEILSDLFDEIIT